MPTAIATNYPYPYPFPLSAVPSDPDLVATAEEAAVLKEGRDSSAYLGYGYECTLGEEKARGVRLEIRPGRNPRWEAGEVEVEAVGVGVAVDEGAGVGAAVGMAVGDEGLEVGVARSLCMETWERG